jgi:hypothetical protein
MDLAPIVMSEFGAVQEPGFWAAAQSRKFRMKARGFYSKPPGPSTYRERRRGS